jgi:hypothetical protein
MRHLRPFLFGVLLMSFGGAARAQEPIAGQPYQVPPGYEMYGAGTLVSYGGFNYVVQGDGTMLLGAAPTVYPNQQFGVYYQPYHYYRPHYYHQQHWYPRGHYNHRLW